ncbi:MAG TPA: long-chain fatty acid--CoA ligase [Streptosporangiaceae bacterium]|nr:long-chain fatty acid--CoA ligase [Streptosporangiaceae bacterium]
MCETLAMAAGTWPDRPAYSDRPMGPGGPAGDWSTITWRQVRERALELAAGFAALGLRPGERVALMLPNRLEHVLADLGVVHAGGVPVTFYPTLSAEQVAYQAADCDARIAVLDGAAELARWQPVLSQLPGLKHVIVRDAAVCPPGEPFRTWAGFTALGRTEWPGHTIDIEGRVAGVRPQDPVTVLYTSGTTGTPKGVIITHANVAAELAAIQAVGNARPHTRWVSYLPLAHIAERMFTLYLAAGNGWHVHFCPDAATGLVPTIATVRPTAFFGVPRVWEKIQAGIGARLAAETDETRRAAVAAAMDTGLRYVRSRQYGQRTPDDLAAEFARAEEAVLRPIRSLLGLGDAELVMSAAAPLPPEVGTFFAGLGLRIMDVYGMTETSGAFTTNNDHEFRLGTVGRALPGTELRIAADGEIITRGPLNTPGYLNRPDRTAELFDADGWLHTGDIGSVDSDGFLSVIDRKKELIITAGGENVSPAMVENLLVAHALIGQALAYGDRRPYLVALLTLDAEMAAAWARAQDVAAGGLTELTGHPAVLAEVGAAVAAANQRLARVQQIKAWRLLPTEWTADSEELTPTLKLKRRIIHTKYADTIDSLYASVRIRPGAPEAGTRPASGAADR